jgi:hypothetical protein
VWDGAIMSRLDGPAAGALFQSAVNLLNSYRLLDRDGIQWVGNRATISVVNTDEKNRMRLNSMYGTALFALGIMAAVVSLLTRSVWLGGAAASFLLLGIVLLYRVGKSL